MVLFEYKMKKILYFLDYFYFALDVFYRKNFTNERLYPLITLSLVLSFNVLTVFCLCVIFLHKRINIPVGLSLPVCLGILLILCSIRYRKFKKYENVILEIKKRNISLKLSYNFLLLIYSVISFVLFIIIYHHAYAIK